MKSGLAELRPHRRDYSLLDTYGAIAPDPAGLPLHFSIYDGQAIPDQDALDERFTPALPPMPYGCTGETGAFESGMQDGKLYSPRDLYLNTPPGNDGGRDMRDMLATLIRRGPRDTLSVPGPRRSAYFNCYGAGAIDDFDAARIALWINQYEKRGVYVGSWWYPDFGNTGLTGSLPMPSSFNTAGASLHCHLVVGWRTLPDGTEELQDISWQGSNYATAGVCWISRKLYNALMAQPYTGAFTITKGSSATPVPIGITAVIDHLVYFVRQLFRA